ncbi:proprotein convertase subtilisin/kexin type 4 [Platysternon megacephalum]|uniref:Proprotein convertase subtilisin/kexin type 4 n=1 Tax=Platysternon megacephalum TaxID=55544 RepID=A0A4D9E815_9SAUR|nr:proprotein convertase subtilisin/kexin type 4 [Platysternon megacephalum]
MSSPHKLLTMIWETCPREHLFPLSFGLLTTEVAPTTWWAARENSALANTAMLALALLPTAFELDMQNLFCPKDPPPEDSSESSKAGATANHEHSHQGKYPLPPAYQGKSVMRGNAGCRPNGKRKHIGSISEETPVATLRPGCNGLLHFFPLRAVTEAFPAAEGGTAGY